MGIVIFAGRVPSSGRSTILSYIAEGYGGVQVDRLALAVGEIQKISVWIQNHTASVENLRFALAGINSIHITNNALAISSFQRNMYQLGVYLTSLQNIIVQYTKGNPFQGHQNDINSLVKEVKRIQAALGELSTDTTGIQLSELVISEEVVQSFELMLLELEEKATIVQNQVINLFMDDLTATIPAINWEIYLDGTPIKNNVKAIRIDFDEGNVHNALTVTVNDFNLYFNAKPEDNFGSSRFEVHIGSRVLYFTLEDRSGNHDEYTLWGRSLTAQEDAPHRSVDSFQLEAGDMASNVIGTLANTRAVTYTAPDWPLPESFQYEGTPVTGILKIAEAAGAVVRSDDDGSFIVRPKWGVRPVDMPQYSGGLKLDAENNLINFSYTVDRKTPYNRITVSGTSEDSVLPDLVVEEGEKFIGDTAYVRAYWKKAPIPTPGELDTYVTDGIATQLGTFDEDIIDEVVEFKDGVATMSRPVQSIYKISWVGRAGTNPTVIPYSKEITIGSTTPHIAKISYRSRYTRFKLTNHNVERLIFVLYILTSTTPVVEVVIGDGDIEAPAIDNDLLTTDSICVTRGTAWLDDNRYTKDVYNFTIPYNDTIRDGGIIYIADSKLGILGNARIVSYSISINGPVVLIDGVCEKCRV